MKIALLVTSVHLLLIGGLFVVHPPKQRMTRRQHLKVQTVVLAPPKPTPTPEVKETAVTQAPPKPKPTPPKPKPVAKKKSTPKPITKNPPKPETPKPAANHSALISLMQQSLETLDSTPTTPIPVTPQKSLGELASETLSFDTHYEDELILYLQALLTLPEKGEVKVKVTVERSGVVQAVHILSAASVHNRRYVETTLPKVSLPSFGTQYKGEAKHTFTLTLTAN